MDWLKKNSESLTFVSIVIGAAIWMTASVHQLENKMSDESKDFHGRLCILEERYMQMMQRILEGKN